ncbi:MAG: DNA polymerase III subunit gamma/tau [Planctomycetes bacterium]|nr:DNA polymerase III subunit gamma/tau [Planctomycetota bacterium]
MAKRKTAAKTVSTPPPEPRAEEYTVLARRYRPQQFEDLVGQEPVAQALANALKSGRVAHAYLFTGARGVGKTSTARILAKALNCVKGPTITPCDECELCRGIAAGEDVDVLEIDGASNRGIDEVREIRQNVQYRPSRARYKIYIIDEVHMLTTPAFNALLKTLEEPPGHVKFIFATTEVQKIPITILSRCQRFDFAGIGAARIVECLQDILAGEGKEADDEALAMVARRAGGSMRDAQSLLDQLLSFGGDRLTQEQVHSLLGTASVERVGELAAAVLDRDARRALALLQNIADSGLQLAELLDQLIEYWRDLLVVQCAGMDNQTLSVGPGQREALQAQAQAIDADAILAGLDILVSAKNRMRNSSHGKIVLEITLVRLSRLDNLVSLTQIGQWLAGDGTVPARPQRASVPSIAATLSPPKMVEPPEKKKLAAEVNSLAHEADRELLAPAEPRPPGRTDVGADRPAESASTHALTAENVPIIWSQLLTQIGPMLASILGKSENVAISAPNTLVVRFPPGYNLDENHYLDPTRVSRLEELLGKLTGRPCKVRIEASSPNASQAAVSREAAAVSETATSSPTSFRRSRQEAMQVPLVTRAMEVLGAQIVQIDEGFGVAQQTSASVAGNTDAIAALDQPEDD